MKNKKIMLVDDDAELIDAIRSILENQHFTVVTANNKAEGLEIAGKENPDLAILDVMMTYDQEGFDLANELRNDPRFRELPIIMMTGVDKEKGVDFKSSAGDDWLPVNGYLEKPVQPHMLIAEVRKHI